MASPVADSYSCASGGVIAGGCFVAPSIAGSVWTPARDGSGNVLAGNWVGLPLNTWVNVDGVMMNTVIETPHYTSQGGGDSASGIINAWGGAAWDYTQQEMYIKGGGHSDTSACETGIYKLNAAKLAFSRVHDRAPMSQVQGWNGSTHALEPGEHWGTGGAPPLLNGEPCAIHTYYGLVWVPPAVLGNTSGGIFSPGSAKGVWDIDTDTWKTVHWDSPDVDFQDWSNCAAFIDGSKIYGPNAWWYHYRFDLTQTDATTWSPTSFGKMQQTAISTGGQTNVGSAVWGWLRERRETFSFSASGLFSRIRYGAALDAGLTNWSGYYDVITLTSSDGSHSDFNSANLTGDSLLGGAGVVYDQTTATAYIQANLIGGQLYKITGLSGNTWTTEKIAGTAALAETPAGTFGRLQLASLAGKKILLRVTRHDQRIQAMRIS